MGTDGSVKRHIGRFTVHQHNPIFPHIHASILLVYTSLHVNRRRIRTTPSRKQPPYPFSFSRFSTPYKYMYMSKHIYVSSVVTLLGIRSCAPHPQKLPLLLCNPSTTPSPNDASKAKQRKVYTPTLFVSLLLSLFLNTYEYICVCRERRKENEREREKRAGSLFLFYTHTHTFGSVNVSLSYTFPSFRLKSLALVLLEAAEDRERKRRSMRLLRSWVFSLCLALALFFL